MIARRNVLAAGLWMLALLALPANAQNRNPWTIPGTLRVAIVADPQTLDPILQTNIYQGFINALCFDGLLASAGNGDLYPALARRVPTFQNGDISRDGKTIRFELRRGVVFHDGAPFTSADVAFTWRARMNPKNNVVNRLGYNQIERIDTPDPYTAVLHMKRAYSPILTVLAGGYILPAHLLAKYPDLNQAAFNDHPIGTGPYKFVRWIRGDRIEYVRNDRYFEKPRLTNIVVKIIPQDSTAALQVRTHDIDWYPFPQTTSYRQSQGIPGIRTLALSANAVRQIVINTTHPPLDDVRVRQALALAIDRKLITEHVAYDTAQAACGDLPSSSWAYDPTVTCRYDPEEARRILAELGWEPGADGILVRNGRPLGLTMVFAAGATETAAVALQLQAMLKAVGVDTELHTYAGSMLFAPAADGGILESGRFDLDVSAFYSPPDPDDSRLLTCANRAPAGFNVSRYCSPEMDAAQRESLQTFDRAQRKRVISRIQHMVVRDVPTIYLWWPKELHLVNSDVSGIEVPPGVDSPYTYMWSI
ncbi:MAG TPA: peptide ABC transporter substrate-binding protein [Candidatus Acidoferrales bacterium]|nr:peptide ABC transporter substrate-binding protein [Candidatus Acidoferrales bacterium]